MTSAQELGKGGVNDAGRPIFVATEHTKYTANPNRELTDQEQLAWKSFQLWKTTMAIERRDHILHDVINSDFTNFHLSNHIMGTPYPVIENTPGFGDTIRGIRLYEHGISISSGLLYNWWIRSKPSTRVKGRLTPSTARGLKWGTMILTELCFAYRSMFRLTGHLPNDYECRKYGVMESKERLEQKVAMWQKYSDYKKEWCRRYDYHVFGIRPGEHLTLWSSCWFPAWAPSFGTETNYPMRKNPYFLSTTPLKEYFVENPNGTELQRDDNVPMVRARPEIKYVYHGPIDASKTTH